MQTRVYVFYLFRLLGFLNFNHIKKGLEKLNINKIAMYLRILSNIWSTKIDKMVLLLSLSSKIEIIITLTF